ncbi:MAG: ribonuclease R [Natronospirillum sp.]|uniref:ribonuclease R n=1 Tax=Natronospirillum sp. TaxID=2812955 RepID=UPI0025F7F605|nr:ribonuclease R [Natronospirillum sp.]MCH8550713.1 ribonuclease R [Natronospirillum sp.]
MSRKNNRKQDAPQQDPFLEREAGKYETPVPSREFLLQYLAERQGPATHAELVVELDLQSEEEIEGLRRRLIAMTRDGQVLCSRQGAYALVDRMSLIRGRVQGHPDGHGLLIPDDGGEALALSHRQMKTCFHGDRVLARRLDTSQRGRPEGKIVEVLERNTAQVVGRYHSESGVAYVIPENPRVAHDVLVPEGKSAGASAGDIVTVKITIQPDSRRQPVGEVIEVLGRSMAPGMEIDIALRSHDIPWEWPDDIDAQLRSIPDEVQEKDLDNRFDLRDRPFVTIDGADARDFDDALCASRKVSGGWRLWVAIADVSHYIRPGTPLDQEAERRATSVYFPERVVPMLPEKLSNGLCSLNPAVDRLVMVCEMNIGRNGEVDDYQFYEAVIHSHARLTYEQVWQWMQGSREAVRDQVVMDEQKVERTLKHLVQMHKVFRKARAVRGAMDIETIEPRIVFGADKKIEKIVPYQRNDAHRIIEECMLAANTCTGDLLEASELPALYRVHDGPTIEKLEALRGYLGELGLVLPGGDDPEPEDYRHLMNQIQGRQDREAIQGMILRSLSQAVYQPDNLGHFGLAYDAYAHFTSPIRRYPDLLVHRAIRALIRSGRRGASVKRPRGMAKENLATYYPYDEGRMNALGEHCSHCERRADDATRDVLAWLKCEFMQDHIGDVFNGKITSVLGFGLFVQLEEYWIDGLIHVTALSRDYYVFDAARQRLVGERTRVVHRLGDPVQVRVVRVSLDDRKIDFELVPEKKPKQADDDAPLPGEGRTRKKRARKSRRRPY